MAYKVKETDTHIYFLTGPFSQWHPNKFRGNFKPHGNHYDFNCAEQFMMAAKADLFGDFGTFQDIMEAKTPRDQKQLGRLVKNFDPDVWNTNALDIVTRGNWFRSLQCDDYRSALITSGDKQLIEGNKNDPIWAVGLSWDDPAILNSANWQGTNWLGVAHMRVRDLIKDPTKLLFFI